MKSIPPLSSVLAIALACTALGGCSAFQSRFSPAPPAAVAAAPGQPPGDAASGIQRIPFRVGVSSATVEKMAREQSCTGGQGAGLITEAGPVEVYRMQCDNGKTFMARCEMRQCRSM